MSNPFSSCFNGSNDFNNSQLFEHHSETRELREKMCFLLTQNLPTEAPKKTVLLSCLPNRGGLELLLRRREKNGRFQMFSTCFSDDKFWWREKFWCDDSSRKWNKISLCSASLCVIKFHWWSVTDAKCLATALSNANLCFQQPLQIKTLHKFFSLSIKSPEKFNSRNGKSFFFWWKQFTARDFSEIKKKRKLEST